MEKIDTNRPCIWRIENKLNFWRNQYWHNVKFTVVDGGEEANYEVTKIFDKKDLDEEKYWIDIGKKISELMDNIELARKLKTVKTK